MSTWRLFALSSLAAATLIGCGGDTVQSPKQDLLESIAPSEPSSAENQLPVSGDQTTSLPGQNFALLGGRRGGHYWFDYCEGKPDSTQLPEDPRTLVKPGVSDGKAVYMNAWWQTCQDDNNPGTCGELKARYDRGYKIVASDGEVGAGSFFTGSGSESGFSVSAESYNNMWRQIWFMSSRPDNFDQLVSERWGMPLSATKNPYPLAGEDPNATNGGSGQLPIGLTQLRKADGTWTGELNVTCSICHGGKVGTRQDDPMLGPIYGTNSISDITVMFTDLARLNPMQATLAIISQNKVRGTGNITNFQLFGFLELFGSPETSIAPFLMIQSEPSTGTEDPPVWWNVGSRSAKFFDGAMVMDAKRIELSFHFPDTPMHRDFEADKQWIIDNQQDSDAWIAGQRSPAWPEHKLGAIDKQLAEVGAVLFHSKNLWAENLNNPVKAPPGGNGSCASCHGAYSPRYVNDPSFLATPTLEGVAANITPYDVIQTDKARLNGNSDRVLEAAKASWFAYSDGPNFNEEGVSMCGNWADPSLRKDRELGYLAPPLYGVWATAPYLHNGSVPSLWQVLKPSDRAQIWQRLSNEPRADQAGKVVMGFKTDLETGFDAKNVGWRYENKSCGSLPLLNCSPAPQNDQLQGMIQRIISQIWANGGLAWNLLNAPILTKAQIEDRKVYDTRVYSQSNKGHDFVSVLTDAERLAILEYMKTL